MKVTITQPTEGAIVPLSQTVEFAGTAPAASVVVQGFANNPSQPDSPFALDSVTPDTNHAWAFSHEFSTPGHRQITFVAADTTGKELGEATVSIVLQTDPISCEFKQGFFKVGGRLVSRLPGDSAFFYIGGMAIDADGAFHAYHPISGKGLDDLANAKDKHGNFVGVVTSSQGVPVVQGANDPAPGFFVSSTSLQDTSHSRTNPLRYVNAEQIPFLALPPIAQSTGGAAFGDFAAVYHSATDKLCFAIFADIGPSTKLGECSIALAKAVGVPASARTGGVDSGIFYVVFPGSRAAHGTAWTSGETTADIDTAAAPFFKAWGGLGRIKACFGELN